MQRGWSDLGGICSIGLDMGLRRSLELTLSAAAGVLLLGLTAGCSSTAGFLHESYGDRIYRKKHYRTEIHGIFTGTAQEESG